jgi:hypothetical protein
MGDGCVLRIAINLGRDNAAIDDIGAVPFFVTDGSSPCDSLAPATCAAWLLEADA